MPAASPPDGSPGIRDRAGASAGNPQHGCAARRMPGAAGPSIARMSQLAEATAGSLGALALAAARRQEGDALTGPDVQVPGKGTDVCRVEHHAPGQTSLDAELEVVSGRNLRSRIGCVDRRWSKEDIVRIDVLSKTVRQSRLNVLRRIADEVEHAVALEAVIVDSGAGSDDQALVPCDIPCHAEPRAPLRSAVVLQVLVNSLPGLKYAVERIAGTWNLKTDSEGAQGLSGHRVQGQTRRH